MYDFLYKLLELMIILQGPSGYNVSIVKSILWQDPVQ